MNLRLATPEDAQALALVGSATFLESYALNLPGHEIVRHTPKAHAPEVYGRWLRDPACAVWIVEVGEGTVVGYSVLTPCDLPEFHRDDLELRRIYLLSRFQGAGMGRRMVEAVADEARRRGARRLLLGVYGENQKALGFYERMGFRSVGTREFVVGSKVCSDYVLARPLVTDGLPTP